jgi:hypothetical protein
MVHFGPAAFGREKALLRDYQFSAHTAGQHVYSDHPCNVITVGKPIVRQSRM